MTSLSADDEIRVLYLTGGRRLGGMEHHLIALASRLPPSVRCLVCCLEASADYRGAPDGGRNRARQSGLANPPAPRRHARVSAVRARWSDAFDRTSCIRMVSSPMSSRVCCARRGANVRIITSRRGEDANRRHQAVRRLVNRVSDKVVCVSQETAAFVQSTESPRPGLLTVIPNGVALNDAAASAPSPPKTRRKRNAPVRFGTLGTVKPIKGTDLLVDAFMRFDPTAHVELLIAGLIDRPWAEALRERAQSDARIRFIGRSSQASSFLSSLDVFVLPSRSEGMSNALLEAMASGLPCIATDVGSNRSLLCPPAEPAAGRICEPDAESLFRAMFEMASSAEARLRLRGAARRALVGRNYTIPNMVHEYERLYRSVVGRPAVHAEIAQAPCATE